jgi:hypothetical protein
MIDKPNTERHAASRDFIPEVKPLESRFLLSRSQAVSFPDGFSSELPIFRQLPRTGGAVVQTGSVLGIGVGQPKTNTAQVTDDGGGYFTAEWNGGPVHTLTGIKSAIVEGQRARTNQITFQLNDPASVAVMAVTGAHDSTDAARASAEPRPLGMRNRTSGAAFQSGSVLTVTVDRPTTNTVVISKIDDGGAVEVEWNGGAVHSFTGVDKIVVDTRKARNNVVAIDDATG